jgi:hypothetical protein
MHIRRILDVRYFLGSDKQHLLARPLALKPVLRHHFLEFFFLALGLGFRFEAEFLLRLADVNPPPGHGTECVGRVRGWALAARQPRSNEACDHNGVEDRSIVIEFHGYVSHRGWDLLSADRVILDAVQDELWPAATGGPLQGERGNGLLRPGRRLFLHKPVNEDVGFRLYCALTKALPFHLPSSLNAQKAVIQPLR